MNKTHEEIDINLIDPAPWNKRGEITPESIDKLKKSIEAVGLIHSPVVRRVDVGQGRNGRFQILAGECRFTACKLLGWAKMPADIIEDCDDVLARSITTLENLMRQDLTPIQEAESLADLLKQGMTQAQIAAHTGRPESWVCRRIAITTLTQAWRDLAAKHKLTAVALELVARFPTDTQDQVAAGLTPQDQDTYLARGGNTKMLRQLLTRYVRNLSSAAWRDAHVEWCQGCQKRSDACTDLFEQSAQAYCLDPQCWGRRELGHIEELRKDAEKEHGNGIASAMLADLADYKEEHAKTHSVPVFISSGARAGTIVWTRPDKKEKTKAVAKTATTGKKKVQQPTLEEKRMNWVIGHIIERLKASSAKKGETTPFASKTLAEVVRFVSAFGTSSKADHLGSNAADKWQEVSSTGDDWQSALWKSIVPVLVGRIEVSRIIGCSEHYEEALRVAGWCFGADRLDLIAAAIVAIKEPKKKANGTR